VLGIFAVGLYLVLQSVHVGTALPDLFDGELGVAYTNTVVQPLATLFGNNAVGKAATAFLWGLGGLTVYIIIELITRTFRGLRTAENDVQMTDTTIIRHPGLHSFVIVAAWRIVVVAIFSIIFAAIIQPLVHAVAGLGPAVILGNTQPLQTIRKLALLAIACAVTAHLGIVFLRLFLMRMRLFGEGEY
jgi:hypothetical protein